jgi:hypothetical protein
LIVKRTTPAAGWWSLTDPKRPVFDSVSGKSAFCVPASFLSSVCSVPLSWSKQYNSPALSSPNAENRTVGRTISGISLHLSPSKRAAHRRRVSQSPKI